MATERTQELQTRGPREIATTTEGTRPGVLLTPPVDIFEDVDAITVLADMPGDLTIALHEGVLTITGHAQSQDGSNEVAVALEYPAGTFQRSFTLSEAIDQLRLRATPKHGVLHLLLPKAEQAKPRQIKIQSD